MTTLAQLILDMRGTFVARDEPLDRVHTIYTAFLEVQMCDIKTEATSQQTPELFTWYNEFYEAIKH